MPLALQGTRVVDLSHFLAGPFATMILGDMGADVIKIEAPGRGDEFRYYPPSVPGVESIGAPFAWSNRNKRSVSVNLKSPEGLSIVRDLIADADVLVENFSSGVMKRLGLDYESCKAINPRLIYCSVSAYGREGAFSDRLGFDPIVQAESGYISMNGYGDRPGVRSLSPVMDISTAMMACNAILGALLARVRTGAGQYVEVALFDNAVLMTGYAALQYLVTGAEPQRHGNTSPDTCPSGVFMSSDKPFYINCGNDRIFHRLMEDVLERPDLATDPTLSRRNGRLARQAELFETLEAIFIRHPWSYWQEKMRAASIPCGEVRSLGEALRSGEARERGIVGRVQHPEAGWIPNIRLPIRYSETPIADPRPAPTVGEHNGEILRQVLGYSKEQIAALARSGALGGALAPEAAHDLSAQTVP